MLGQLREVRLDDLLGRDPVHLDLEPVRRTISGTPVLVTGAAGSIGSELAYQVLQYHPSVLVCIDQDESGLFKLQQRLSRLDSNSKVEFCIPDIIVVWVCVLCIVRSVKAHLPGLRSNQ
jgi:FlaA1/EpsC-like NDP-sugar epimerase